MSEIRIQEVQEGAQLMDKLVELLTVGTKWFSDKADAADLAILDKRINERAAEGWELVTYDYMATSMQIKGPRCAVCAADAAARPGRRGARLDV